MRKLLISFVFVAYVNTFSINRRRVQLPGIAALDREYDSEAKLGDNYETCANVVAAETTSP